jgi:hypothetical protein
VSDHPSHQGGQEKKRGGLNPLLQSGGLKWATDDDATELWSHVSTKKYNKFKEPKLRLFQKDHHDDRSSDCMQNDDVLLLFSHLTP